MNTVPMFEEYRENLLECVHYGMAVAVSENGIVASTGQTDWMCYYRSASKPIQSLPTLLRGLHKKYGLTEEEATIFSGSHQGDEEHERVILSIMAKTGLKEEDMIMLPAYPAHRGGLAPRKIYHNCSGKHLCLMLLAREVGDNVRDYWKRDSRAQKLVREMVAWFSDTPYEQVAVGVDGCGVPVFAVPFYRIAAAYLKLSCPELIGDGELRRTVEENMARIHAYPTMIRGRGNVDSIICANPDLIAKSGALGVYAMGIRSKKLGVVFKISDGSHDEMADGAMEIFRQLNIAPETIRAIQAVHPDTIINDNREIVGHRRSVFRLF